MKSIPDLYFFKSPGEQWRGSLYSVLQILWDQSGNLWGCPCPANFWTCGITFFGTVSHNLFGTFVFYIRKEALHIDTTLAQPSKLSTYIFLLHELYFYNILVRNSVDHCQVSCKFCRTCVFTFAGPFSRIIKHMFSLIRSPLLLKTISKLALDSHQN